MSSSGADVNSPDWRNVELTQWALFINHNSEVQRVSSQNTNMGLWWWGGSKLAICAPMIYTAQCVCFDAGSIHYEGKWEKVGPCELAL